MTNGGQRKSIRKQNGAASPSMIKSRASNNNVVHSNDAADNNSPINNSSNIRSSARRSSAGSMVANDHQQQPLTQQPSYNPPGYALFNACDGESSNIPSASCKKKEVYEKYIREAMCTSLWAILSCLIRGFMDILFWLIHSDDLVKDASFWFRFPIQTLFGIGSFFASWLPRKVVQGLASGIFFGSPILLLAMRRQFGIIPSLPIRICEMIMGRVTPRELAILVPIHFLASVVGIFSLKLVLPGFISSNALSPIIYSEENNWIYDFLRETSISALFSVGMLVLPEIFRLNTQSISFYTSLCLIPLFIYSVDFEGRGSSFSPDLIYALRCVSRQEEEQSIHLYGPMLGGIIGGYIMCNYFPDDGFHLSRSSS